MYFFILLLSLLQLGFHECNIGLIFGNNNLIIFFPLDKLFKFLFESGVGGMDGLGFPFKFAELGTQFLVFFNQEFAHFFLFRKFYHFLKVVVFVEFEHLGGLLEKLMRNLHIFFRQEFNLLF